MATVPRPRFQFRLRTLFVVMTLFAVPCAYVGWQAKIVAARKACIENEHNLVFLAQAEESLPVKSDDPIIYAPVGKTRDSFASVLKPAPVTWVRAMLGDSSWACVGLPKNATDSELARMGAIFPEAQIVFFEKKGYPLLRFDPQAIGLEAAGLRARYGTKKEAELAAMDRQASSIPGSPELGYWFAVARAVRLMK